MRDITKLMIYKYNLVKLGFDFMGYEFQKESELSFHHLIVPKRLCAYKHIEEDGYVEWNGAILVQNTAHNYLHIIEQYNKEIFNGITNEIIDEKNNGSIRIENLKRINVLLDYFENEYKDIKAKNGTRLIKEKYKKRVLKKEI